MPLTGSSRGGDPMEKYFPVYFSEWDAVIKTTKPEQLLQVFLNSYAYAKGEKIEPITDPVVEAFCILVARSIDNGVEKANRKSRSTRYSRYCGVCKSKKERPLSFSDWVEQIDSKEENDERQRTSTDVNERQRQSTNVTNSTNVNNHNSYNPNSNNPNSYNHNSLNNEIEYKAPSARPSDFHNEIQNERFVNGEYKPQLWECEIPKMFWGKFQYEDDYYAYAEEHRDEIIKMLDEMENAESKQPA